MQTQQTLDTPAPRQRRTMPVPYAWRYFSAVVEHSDDAIITKNLDGIVTSWNKSAERLFGYSAEEMIGRPVALLIPPDRPNEEPTILARLRRGERIDHYETVRRRKDGSLIHISLTVSPVRDQQGRIIGASKIARDISELRKAREILARSHHDLEKRVQERTASLNETIAQLEEFSYSLSHDLKAPARAMTGYAQALLEDYGDRLDSNGRELLDRIIRGGFRMERLIHDVLIYSRVARCQIEIKDVSLEPLIRDIISQFPEMQPPRTDIIIKRPLHNLSAHEPSLTQAISNLLVNSVKFVPLGTKPQIIIWTRSRPENVRLYIEDNGIGIKPEHQRRLFRLFERAHQDTRFEGTGIGLAIVRKAVERMGGAVGVRSDGITGSTFWIELPSPSRA